MPHVAFASRLASGGWRDGASCLQAALHEATGTFRLARRCGKPHARVARSCDGVEQSSISEGLTGGASAARCIRLALGVWRLARRRQLLAGVFVRLQIHPRQCVTENSYGDATMWGNEVGLAWGFFAPQGELKKSVQVYVSLAVIPTEYQ